jgi:DNA-binding NarL/FixJ family response regulator
VTTRHYTFVVLRRVRRARTLARMAIRILLIDDHPIVRMGLRSLIETEPDMEVVAEAADGADSVALYGEHRPDVVLMDLRMPRMDGTAAISAIRARDPQARIVALTMYDGDTDIFRALEAGAIGYLMKDMIGPDVVNAIRAAAAGRRVIPPAVAGRLAEFTPRVDLTSREVEVLRLAAKGLRNKEIGRAIGRTEETVKVHIRHVMAKLGVTGRTEAVTLAIQRGVIHVDD